MICGDCKNIFEEGILWREPHGEEIMGCPRCGGDYMTASRCERCGEYCDEIDLGFCSSCGNEIISEFEKAISNFSSAEQSFIYDKWAGE